MSGLPVEVTEPDPAATSLPNDQAINKDVGDSSAPSVKETVMADTEDKAANGSAEVKAEVADKTGENGATSEVKEEQTDKKDENNRKRKVRTDENGVLKTSKWEYDGKSGSRYNPEVLPVTDDPKLIRAQVEFYFSDSNLPSDHFLWTETDGASNKPVSINKICSFGRMRRFQPESAVVAALRESTFLVVSGEEGKEEVNRKVAYDPTVPVSKSEPRSVYAKGFGDEEPGSQFDIEAFFAPYGPTRSVRLRRTEEKLFKGSVFVEFQDEETAKKFLDLDPKPLWKGHPLDIKSKKEYMEGKEQDIKDGKIQPQLQRNYGRGRGRGRGNRGGNRGGNERGDRRGERENRDRDPDDWKKRREEDRASGFKDNRKDNRGRGRDGGNRGGRGRREDRGPRNNDRNREREDKEREVKVEDGQSDKHASEEKNGTDDKSVKKVDIKSTVQSEEGSTNGQKRAREEDTTQEKPAKKVDTKTEA